jgi:hypothetical protein
MDAEQHDDTTGAIQALLNSAEHRGEMLQQRIVVPKDMLIPSKFTIILEVENFMGGFSSAVVSVEVVDDKFTPIVQLLGLQSFQIFPNEAISISTVASLPTCAGAAVSLQYKWEIYSNGILTELYSTSVNPFQLNLNEYSFTPGAVVVLTFVADSYFNNAKMRTSVVSANVFVKTAGLSATITGSLFFIFLALLSKYLICNPNYLRC